LKRKILRDFGFKAIAQILIESGIDTKLAQHRAKDYAIAVQGVPIPAQGLDEEM
jgi:hypothetical protein